MITQKELSMALVALGKRIRFLRLTKGITQTALSIECDMEKATVSRIESGLTNITFLTLLRIGKVLHVSIEELLQLPPVV